MRYAENRFSAWASTQDCEDMVAGAMEVLFTKVHDGSLTELNCSLSTYVIGIMKNIALKQYESKSKFVDKPFITGQSDDDEIDPVDKADAEQVIREWLSSDNETEALERRQAVNELVANLTEPCKTILWGFYWENLSMAEIAERTGQSNANVAKTQKSRCMTKVETALRETYKILNS